MLADHVFFIENETEDVHAYGRPRGAGFLSNLEHLLACLAQPRPATGSVFLRNREEEVEGAALDSEFDSARSLSGEQKLPPL
jgi:hypothetical protein